MSGNPSNNGYNCPRCLGPLTPGLANCPNCQLPLYPQPGAGFYNQSWFQSGMQPFYNPQPIYLDQPSYVPTIVISFFFGIFGIIPAIKHSRMAKERGYSQNGYWWAFGGIFGAQTLAGIILPLVLIFAFAQVANNAANSLNTTLPPINSTVPFGSSGVGNSGSTGPVPASDACPASIANVARKTTFSSAPAMLINTSSTYYANFQTDVGNIKIKLEPNLSPITVNSFVFLACYHYYDGTIFHRVIPNFMDQGGDPNGNPPGTGGPGYTIPDEYPTGSTDATPYASGQLAMANTGKAHSGGSQFFIVASQSGAQTLDQDISSPGAEDYTIFGQVVQGMNVVLQINNDGTQSGTPKVTHHLEKVTITSN